MKKIALVTMLVVASVGARAEGPAAAWQIPGAEFVRNHSTALSTFGAAAVVVAVLENVQLPGKFRVANNVSHDICTTVCNHAAKVYAKIKDVCSSVVSAVTHKVTAK